MSNPQPVTIHLLMPHENGPIKSQGLKVRGPGSTPPGGYAVCCNPLAALPRHATGEVLATTCPKCLATDYAKAKLNPPPADELREAPAEAFPLGKPVAAEAVAVNEMEV